MATTIIRNANVVTYSYREAIHDIFHQCIELFQHIAYALKNILHFLFQCIYAPLEKTFTQGIAKYFLRLKILQRMSIVTSKIKTREEPDEHDSSIIHPALIIFFK